MKVVLLCGGLGTRMREETEFRPKPLVEVGGRPILWHIMKQSSVMYLRARLSRPPVMVSSPVSAKVIRKSCSSWPPLYSMRDSRPRQMVKSLFIAS